MIADALDRKTAREGYPKGRADADGGRLGRRMQALHRQGQAQKAVAADQREDAAADRIRAACADPVTGSTTDVGDIIAARVGN
jgi:hypothetical protein